jgi:hypothetical protein
MAPDGFTVSELAAVSPVDFGCGAPPAVAGSNWLADEYYAALRRTPFAAVQALVSAGVTWRTIAKCPPASARVTVERGFYQPDPEGGAAYLLPVRVESPVTPEAIDPAAAVSSGAIVDLLAFHPRHPGSWALRTGNAEWLGAVEPQYLLPGRVPVWRSPLNWLRAGCIGIVPLSREPGVIYRLLSGFWEIAVEDDEHEAELVNAFERARRLPRLIVGGKSGSTGPEDGVRRRS